MIRTIHNRSTGSLAAFLIAVGTTLAPASTSAQTRPTPAMAAGLRAADSLVQAAVASNLIPGAVLVVSHNGKVLQNRAFGYAELYDFNVRRLTHPRAIDRKRVV